MLDRAAHIDPWRVTEAAYPKAGTLPEQLAYLLNYAVLAPSGENSQPWRFRIENHVITFHKDVSRTRPIADPQARELTISVGAALLSYRVALSRFGHRHRIELHDSGNPVAMVFVGEGPLEPFDEALFAGMMRRVTCRVAFDGTPIPETLQQQLIADAAADGVMLSLVKTDRDKLSLAELIAEGDRIQYSRTEYRQEHAKWLRHRDTTSRDGINPEVLGMPSAMDKATGLLSALVKVFNTGGSQANRDHKLAAEAPVLGVISTSGDDQDDWLKAGMATQRILLRSAAAGFSTSFLNQPIEVAAMRPAVASSVGRKDYPQMIFRLGHSPRDLPHAPRRPVGDVIDA